MQQQVDQFINQPYTIGVTAPSIGVGLPVQQPINIPGQQPMYPPNQPPIYPSQNQVPYPPIRQKFAIPPQPNYSMTPMQAGVVPSPQVIPPSIPSTTANSNIGIIPQQVNLAPPQGSISFTLP